MFTCCLYFSCTPALSLLHCSIMLHSVLFPPSPQPKHHFKFCLLNDLFSTVIFFLISSLYSLLQLTSYLPKHSAPKPATAFQWYFSNAKYRCSTALQDLPGIFLVTDPWSTLGVMMDAASAHPTINHDSASCHASFLFFTD